MVTAVVKLQSVERGRRARSGYRSQIVKVSASVPSFVKERVRRASLVDFRSSNAAASASRQAMGSTRSEDSGMTVSLAPGVAVQLAVRSKARLNRSTRDLGALTSFEVTGPKPLYDFLSGFVRGPAGVSYATYRLRGVCAPFSVITLDLETRYAARAPWTGPRAQTHPLAIS